MMSLRGVAVFRTFLGMYEVFYNILPDEFSNFTRRKFNESTTGYYLQSNGMLPSEFKIRFKNKEFGDFENIRFIDVKNNL